MADKSDWDIDSWKREDQRDELQDEIAQLKAEVARLTAERDAAVVQGLEWALNNCAGLLPQDVDAIAAEIAKRKKNP